MAALASEMDSIFNTLANSSLNLKVLLFSKHNRLKLINVLSKEMQQLIPLIISIQRVKTLTDMLRVSFLWSKFIFPQ